MRCSNALLESRSLTRSRLRFYFFPSPAGCCLVSSFSFGSHPQQISQGHTNELTTASKPHDLAFDLLISPAVTSPPCRSSFNPSNHTHSPRTFRHTLLLFPPPTPFWQGWGPFSAFEVCLFFPRHFLPPKINLSFGPGPSISLFSFLPPRSRSRALIGPYFLRHRLLSFFYEHTIRRAFHSSPFSPSLIIANNTHNRL